MVRKKILIITYYWPPAGGPGVQRWLKFTKYLPEFGWKPTVFIPENPSYPLLDESLSKDLSPDLETIKTKIWEPYQLAEIFSKKNKKFKSGQFDIGENQSFMSKLSIFIREKARGKHIGNQLYASLERNLQETGFVNLLVCIALPNNASLTFHKKHGYEQVAHFKKVGYKFDKWYDIVWMQKRLLD